MQVRSLLFLALAAFVTGCESGPAPATTADGAPTPVTPADAAPAAPDGLSDAGASADAAPGSALPNSELAAALTAVGLDVNALPALDALTSTQRSAVMKSFAQALGVSCTGCHQPGDFAATTPQKNVAAHMWNDFLRRLARTDGQSLYCDSCHAGRLTFLDRTNPQALMGYMKRTFVDGIQRRDGQPHGCATCHGTPFDPNFLDTWKKG